MDFWISGHLDATCLHFSRLLKLKKSLYRADFSGKSWYETLDSHPINILHFVRSKVEGCLYILREGGNQIRSINYVDDASYYSNNEDFRLKFEQSLKKRFNLSLLGHDKWYLGMKIKQSNNHITLDQEQYIKNIIIRFQKNFKQQFKVKNTSVHINFVPTKTHN